MDESEAHESSRRYKELKEARFRAVQEAVTETRSVPRYEYFFVEVDSLLENLRDVPEPGLGYRLVRVVQGFSSGGFTENVRSVLVFEREVR